MAKDNPETMTIELTIDSRLEHVRLLSGALQGIGQDLGLSADLLPQLDLIMVEAVNNVIEHAYQMQAGHAVSVKVMCSETQAEVVVSDQGRAMPESVHAGDHEIQDPFALPEGGWGLSLIQAMSDAFHYVSDERGNHLHVMKQLA